MSRICYVCNNETPRAFFLTGLKSKHSERTCIEIIDEILGCFISHRDIDAASNCICMSCFKQIEEYEFHCVFVESRKQKLHKMLVETESVLILSNNRNVSIKRSFKQLNTNRIETNQSTASSINRLPGQMVRLAGSNKKVKLIKVVLKKTAPSKPVILTPAISEAEVEESPPIASPIESIISEIEVEQPESEPTNPTVTPELATENLLNAVQPEPMAIDKAQPQVVFQKKSFIQTKKIDVNNWIQRTRVVVSNGHRIQGFQCVICDRKFVDRRSFKRHKVWHQKYKGWCCFTCHLTFPDKESLLAHEKLHVGRPALECTTCGKLSKTKSILIRHVDIHRAPDKLCDFCGKAFNSMEYLKAHRREVHIRDWQGECETCGFTSFNRSNLVCHIKSHLDDRPHTCSYCGYAFKRIDTLKTHERRHTQDTKTLKCTLCSAKFEHKFYLNQHMKKKHQAENLSHIPSGEQ